MNPRAITTFTGRRIDVFALRVEDVDLVDIAHALSQLCRWTGHTTEFYSVAQHSVLVCDRLWIRTGSPRIALTGLLHDAAEAYLGDMASPLKHTPWADGYRQLEADVTQVIARRFDLPLDDLSPLVHEADLEVLATEARDLMPLSDRVTEFEPLGAPILPLSSRVAERAFRRAWDFHSVAVLAGAVR